MLPVLWPVIRRSSLRQSTPRPGSKSHRQKCRRTFSPGGLMESSLSSTGSYAAQTTLFGGGSQANGHPGNGSVWFFGGASVLASRLVSNLAPPHPLSSPSEGYGRGGRDHGRAGSEPRHHGYYGKMKFPHPITR